MTITPQRRLEDKVLRDMLLKELGETQYHKACQLLDQLLLQAHTDNLTGLLRADVMEQSFNPLLETAQTYGFPFSLLMLDHDHFKEVNDNLERGYDGLDGNHYTGHPAGDALLRDSSHAIKETLRSHDIIIRSCEEPAVGTSVAVRYGGDEFIIGIPFASIQEPSPPSGYLPFPLPIPALAVGGRLLQSVKRATRGHTVSIGIANYPGTSSHADLSTLIIQADRALYIAKGRGGDRCEIWRPEFDLLTPLWDEPT